MGELVGCVRAHGMTRAEWVIPRGLDRYGLELLVLTTDGIFLQTLRDAVGPVDVLVNAAGPNSPRMRRSRNSVFRVVRPWGCFLM